MRTAWSARSAGFTFGIGLMVLAGCSSAPSSTGAPPAVAPSPFLLQYVGEYDVAGRAGIDQLVLHVDGTFDASLDGQGTSGTYAGATDPGKASVTLWTKDGETLNASFRSGTAPGVPAQPFVDTVRADGSSQTLVGPWIADNEGMCDATHGTWHDDDVDSATGLRCTCGREDVYLPSRGGCVATRDGGDPPRLPVSDAAREKAGMFDGSKRVASMSLATDGKYRATIDGQAEEGTWWDAAPLTAAEGSVSIACTSALHAFGAAFAKDGTLTIVLGPDDSETLSRRSR